MADRSAVDTIKGYFYQFDLAIISLLKLKEGADTIIVEGIEDVDVHSASEETAVQCKYYAKTEYNHSVIAKPIRLMLDHYKEVVNGNKKRINYKLYGHFESGQDKLAFPIDVDFLKDHFLTYTKEKVKRCHHTELGLGDEELKNFISLLAIDILASEYQSQLSEIFNLLMKLFDCSLFEAEHFYYNNSLKLIKNAAIDGDILNRTIKKSEFLSKINTKEVLFNEWFIGYKGKKKHFSELRKEYFTQFNISPFERFFVIEVSKDNYSRSELKSVLHLISQKWSQVSNRTPEPFCPYIYLHEISQQELIDLKNELHQEGFKFKDGFDFSGAAFSPESISEAMNKAAPVSLKILNESSHVGSTLDVIKKTKEVYQFYLTNEFFSTELSSVKHVKIQISKLQDIKDII